VWKTGTISGTGGALAAISKIRNECLENAMLRFNAAFNRMCEAGFASISSRPGEGRVSATGIGVGHARAVSATCAVRDRASMRTVGMPAMERDGGRGMSDTRINRAHGIDLEDLDVVVVDDSKPMQTIVRSMLNAARVHRVRTFDNAGEAYRAMLVEPPHLLITDWNLPDADGLSLVHSMRDPRSGALVAVPAILITGHATRRLVERAIASGIHFVLAKPLSPANVLKRIDATIADARRFVFDRTRGHYVLDGADELLAGQRQRWHDLQEGVRRSSVTRLVATAPAAAKPTVTKPTVATRRIDVAASSDEAADRRRAYGFGNATKHAAPGETSTGQAPHQAS
jgi:two-component system chemotaxis response regulator CheY